MTLHDPNILPGDLPAPQDDGATRHLMASEYDEAIASYEGALAIASDDEKRATTRKALAQAIFLRDGGKAAIPVLEQTIAETEKVYGAQHPQTAEALELLGRSFLEAGDKERALEVQTRVLAIREAAFAPDNREIGAALQILANIEMRRKNAPRAKESCGRWLSTLPGKCAPLPRLLFSARWMQTSGE